MAPSLLGRCALDGHSHLPRTLLLPATHTMDCSLTKRWEQAPKICAFSFVCEWVCSMLPGSMNRIGDRCAAGYRLSFAAQSAFSNYPHYRMLFDEAVGAATLRGAKMWVVEDEVSIEFYWLALHSEGETECLPEKLWSVLFYKV